MINIRLFLAGALFLTAPAWSYSDYVDDIDMKEHAAPPPQAVPAPSDVFNFDRDAIGKLPSGWESGSDAKAEVGQWIVRQLADAPSPKNVLTRLNPPEPSGITSFLFLKNTARDRAEIAVQFKTLSTDDEQTVGFVFHYQDAQNYYLLAMSTRHDSGSVYQIKKGKRKLIDMKESIMPPYRWHSVRLVFTPTTYTVQLDRDLLMGGKFKPQDRPGRLGLFVASDTAVVLDEFRLSK